MSKDVIERYKWFIIYKTHLHSIEMKVPAARIELNRARSSLATNGMATACVRLVHLRFPIFYNVLRHCRLTLTSSCTEYFDHQCASNWSWRQAMCGHHDNIELFVSTCVAMQLPLRSNAEIAGRKARCRFALYRSGRPALLTQPELTNHPPVTG
jgi:hypothetical protein